MGVSVIDTQREIILDTIKNTTQGDWKVLVVDEQSRKLIDNVVKEDDILNLNITNIEQIEDRRPMNKDMDVIYFLSPLPHIVDCIMADFERKRYRGAFIIWTGLLPKLLRERIDKSQNAQSQLRMLKVMNLEFYPRESHLITFRDPWSFPVLFHPACNNLVAQHMEDLAQKIVSVCVSLGEYPTIRYYRPRSPTHEASVLASHLARFVQQQIDMYAQYHENFPPPSNRPRGALYIVDRSMDLYAPFIHEFTYQAMAHDLLPIKEGEKVTYKSVLNEGRPGEEEKEMEIGEKDKIWVENRHRHMKDTIEKLMSDFQKFIDENPHFTSQDKSNANSLNAIKDLMAGLPQFQEMKEAYSLHLSMAQDCMNIFQHRKLPDLASVEQILATGLDEDYRKPKSLTDQLIRTLDEPDIVPSDRLRLLALYLLYKDGLLTADLRKLLAHAQLPPQDGEVLSNLDLLGARVAKGLKDNRPAPLPLFPRKSPPPAAQEEYALSRFETNLKLLLEAHVSGAIDSQVFPSTKPHITDDASIAAAQADSTSSLRSAKPTWAKSKLNSLEPRQRVIVFMAGGATYSESRACYEVSQKTSRDVFLVTSHMLTPSLFLRQLGDLSVDKRRLGIPAEQPKPKAPAHLFEREPEPKPAPPPQQTGRSGGLPGRPGPAGGFHGAPSGAAVAQQKLPTQQMGAIKLNGPSGGQGSHFAAGKVEEKKKKKHHFGFGSKK